MSRINILNESSNSGVCTPVELLRILRTNVSRTFMQRLQNIQMNAFRAVRARKLTRKTDLLKTQHNRVFLNNYVEIPHKISKKKLKTVD